MRLCGGKTSSRFSRSSTAEEVTYGIDGTSLTAIVTGASRGIGLETARVLALRGVEVVMAVRNMVAGEEAKDRILEDVPSAKIDVMELDSSSIASVRNFASQFTSSNRPLNILINNAGAVYPNFTLSQDNIELHFATNHLGHFLLALLLLDTMKHTAAESGREGRIINVSSSSHKFCQGIRFQNLNDPSHYLFYNFAYYQSKLANTLHANQLATRLKDDGVNLTANSVDPGFIHTNLFRDKGSWKCGLLYFLSKLFFKDVAQGAATICYVALHPEVNGQSGKYFVSCNIGKPSRQARNSILGRQLWDFSMDLIKQ